MNGFPDEWLERLLEQIVWICNKALEFSSLSGCGSPSLLHLRLKDATLVVLKELRGFLFPINILGLGFSAAIETFLSFDCLEFVRGKWELFGVEACLLEAKFVNWMDPLVVGTW